MEDLPASQEKNKNTFFKSKNDLFENKVESYQRLVIEGRKITWLNELLLLAVLMMRMIMVIKWTHRQDKGFSSSVHI